jgi:hypothetical protein
MTSTDAAAEARETVYAAIELSKKTWYSVSHLPTAIVRAFTASPAATSRNWSAGSVLHPGMTVGSWSVTKPV